MIQELLKKLGFSAKEAEVYLAILESGKVTPADVAKLTGINRTTVYSVAKELVKRGVVNEDLGGETLYLIALPPQDLNQLAKKEEKDLQEKKKLITEAIGELKNYAKNTKYSVPKIVFIGEDDLENYLYKQSPVWNDSIAKYDNTWWGFQDSSFVRYYEDWIDWYWQKGSSKITKLKLLSDQKAETIKKEKYTNRQIKFWSENNNFTATTWVNGDYVVMIVTSQHPNYLVEIHDSVLAHNMREIFKGLWKQVKG